MIDWTNPAAQVTAHFTVRECCYLPSWSVLHQPSNAEQANLTQVCELMEKVREFLGTPINVHCMIRPQAVNAPGDPHDGQDYNAAVGGASHSAHAIGLACDFDAEGLDCDDVRARLLPELEGWGCRMEQRSGSGNWVHVDLAPVTGHRYFKP